MIKLDLISKIYGKGDIRVEALKDVSFALHEGDFVSIVGHSGSGKSTLMNIIGCLDKATTGTYILDGENINDVKDHNLAAIRNKKIGFVFQSFNLLPKLTALRNVELSLIYMGISRKERKERARQALEKVGLSDRLHHRPTELSGGQKQRVAIARAIVTNPAIILADEPTGNLDSESTMAILSIFKQLNSEGKTIIIVTHEPDVAAITKRMLSFQDGYLIGNKEVSQ